MSKISIADVVALKQSGEFDPDWYINQYPDVSASGMDPAEHYLWLGKQIGRHPSPSAARSGQGNTGLNSVRLAKLQPTFRSFGIIEHNPLISILIVSFNSSVDLKVLLPTIANQTYRNFEVILIENGDEDTESLLRQNIESYQFRRENNVGFAQANNIASKIANGELFSLINPDTRLCRDFLQNLLDAMRYDESAAVVVPKINFFERFINLRITANCPFSVCRGELLRDLSYKKIFTRTGTDKGETLHSNLEGELTLDIPYENPRNIYITLNGLSNITKCSARIGYSEEINWIQEEDRFLRIDLCFDANNCSSSRYLVNNAGTALHPDGSPYDRGFAQFDDGTFFSKAYVNALCGCAALVRRIAVMDRDLLAGPFFAYYEDSELSHWLSQNGYRILYQPDAVIFHRHSESTEEHSLLWNVLVRRSRKLYDLFTGADTLPLSFFSFDYPPNFDGPLRKKLEDLDQKICEAESHHDLITRDRPTACIYNTYFSSMGGGEKHALDLITLLSEEYEIYLASEKDFNIQNLEKYFSVDLKKARKIVCTNIDAHFTSKFDLFINSTFRSNLIPAAKENLYVVSFPHIDVDQGLINSYKFLHNSPYTADWATKFWGFHNSEVILPILGEYKSLFSDVQICRKEKALLSVGRFTYDGHCKNHHLILNAYKNMVDLRPELGAWILRIVGSCDYTQQRATDYLQDLRRAAKGYNVEILPNAERSVLDAAYTSAAIYVHATGLSVSEESPELHEHFGISTFEAAVHGCLPVVYHLGGPAAQAADLPRAKLFQDDDSLQRALVAAISDVEEGNVDPQNIRERARSVHRENLQFTRKLLLGNSDLRNKQTFRSSYAA